MAMIDHIKRFWRLFRSPKIPPPPLPIPPRRIEMHASPSQSKVLLIDLIGFEGTLLRRVSVHTPVRLGAVILHSTVSPQWDTGLLQSWFGNSEIGATVRVVEGETDGTTRT